MKMVWEEALKRDHFEIADQKSNWMRCWWTRERLPKSSIVSRNWRKNLIHPIRSNHYNLKLILRIVTSKRSQFPHWSYIKSSFLKLDKEAENKEFLIGETQEFNITIFSALKWPLYWSRTRRDSWKSVELAFCTGFDGKIDFYIQSAQDFQLLIVTNPFSKFIKLENKEVSINEVCPSFFYK
jgi:hypothetical protein